MKRENLVLDIVFFKEREIRYNNQEGLVNAADIFTLFQEFLVFKKMILKQKKNIYIF